MAKLIPPHGGELKPLLLQGEALSEQLARAATLPQVRLSSREVGDLIMLGIGGFTPLTGFMNHADWQGVCDNYTLTDGNFFPVPITLSTDKLIADKLELNQDIALVNSENNAIMAVLNLAEKYSIDKKHEAKQIFRTDDPAHPGVKMLFQQGEINLAGQVKVLSQGDFPLNYPTLFLTPAETRKLFAERGWSTIAAFQTRNPMHRSHEYLVKIAIEICDGVLVHSLLGNLKADDIPAPVRTKAIDVLIQNYFVKNSVIQAGYPLDMRYAGPREALLHALFRQNYGCSHLIVGRDHAGVGNYYGPFDAHNIFDQIPSDALMIKPLKLDWTFWCYSCGGMASMKTCPHTAAERLMLSGTKLRELLANNQTVTAEFSRPEVLAVLRQYYQNQKI
jgi:sulfate adenylyltransferase